MPGKRLEKMLDLHARLLGLVQLGGETGYEFLREHRCSDRRFFIC
jgi:hypothetical protein